MRLIKLKGGKETIMENQLIMNNDIRPKNLIKFLTLAAIFSVAIIGTAHADDDNRGRIQNNHRNGRIQHNDSRQWREHENATRRYWQQRHYVPEPTVVYAPPAYYYPEPRYESPGLNFIFPLHIR